MITHFPPFRVQCSPKSNFHHKKSIFPHLHFHQNRQFSFSANFRRTQKLENSSKFYYYTEYSSKPHVSNFRNGGKLTFRGGSLTWGNFNQKMGENGWSPNVSVKQCHAQWAHVIRSHFVDWGNHRVTFAHWARRWLEDPFLYVILTRFSLRDVEVILQYDIQFASKLTNFKFEKY